MLVLFCLGGSHTEYPRSHNTREFSTKGSFQQEIGSLRCPTAVQPQTCDKHIWLLQIWLLKVLRLSAVNKLFLDRFAFVCPSCSVKYQAAGILLCKGGWRAGSVPPRVQTGASRILNEWKQQGRSASFRRASDQLSA